MPPDFFKSIASVLDRNNLDVVLIGGWAVNHHGFHRNTRDIDFAFASSRKDEIITALNEIGYTAFSDSSIVTRMEFREPLMPIVDILWVDDATHRTMLESSENLKEIASLRVIGLHELLAMKLHALKQADQRGEKDLLDIITLLKHNAKAPTKEEFQALCERFGPPRVFDDLSNKWNL